MITSVFDEKTNTVRFDLAEPPEPQAETAQLEQVSSLRNVVKFEVMGLPLGAAGGVAVADYLIDRFLSERLAQWGAFGELGLAWVIKTYGAKFLGKGLADAAALVFTYEAIRETVTGWIDGVWPAGTAKGAVRQAQNVASQTQARAQQQGYYDRILRR